jgi:hypothetical protein
MGGSEGGSMGGCEGGGESGGTGTGTGAGAGGGGVVAVAVVRAVEETEGSVKEAEKMMRADVKMVTRLAAQWWGWW